MEYIPWSDSPYCASLRLMDRGFDVLRKILGKNIRRLRLERMLSQEALAFDAGIDRTYISQIERGVINPSLLVLFKIGKVLAADVSVMLKKSE